MNGNPLLHVSRLVKTFDITGGFLDQLVWRHGRLRRKKTIVRAVTDVSLDIMEGETVSVVGESGCGKSTLARMVMGVYPPDSGAIHFRGERLDNLPPHRLRTYRTKMQMVFQDPYASLNPRMSVRAILEEPVRFHNKGISSNEIKDRVAQTMLQVGVDPGWMDRYPHEFSGGQRQRISIARALVVDPEFITADEPIAALDVSIQAQILNLLMDAQEQRRLTYLFISHDLSVVRHISNRVAVMYLGTLCELADTEILFHEPRHPYTKALLSAIPRLGRKGFSHMKIEGEVPTPIDLPSGCVFHTRCPHASSQCSEEIPRPILLGNGSTVACHRVADGSI
jgi:peptide/nickel transport system ATP-binding protein